MNAHQRRKRERKFESLVRHLKERNDLMYADWSCLRVLSRVESSNPKTRTHPFVWVEINDPASIRVGFPGLKKILPLRIIQVYRSTRGLNPRCVAGKFHKQLHI